jgi:3-isopropylmalate/(R)-2-methylmalate dehydratase small subunit
MSGIGRLDKIHVEKFVQHTGRPVVIDRANIDTDQIIPKQFLKRIERSGYGQFLFYDWRFNLDDTLNNDFVLNDSAYADASILVAGPNFGCGSSREHAPWSLLDYGFRVVIAPSFADIFYNNSLKNGLLPVPLTESEIAQIGSNAGDSDYSLTIDLENRTVTDNRGLNAGFQIDEFHRHCLLNALDDIGLTLEHESKIAEFEARAAQVWRFQPFTG